MFIGRNDSIHILPAPGWYAQIERVRGREGWGGPGERWSQERAKDTVSAMLVCVCVQQQQQQQPVEYKNKWICFLFANRLDSNNNIRRRRSRGTNWRQWAFDILPWKLVCASVQWKKLIRITLIYERYNEPIDCFTRFLFSYIVNTTDSGSDGECVCSPRVKRQLRNW